MYGYERSYKTGRAVTSWLEFVGWVIVVLGVVVALAGFASGGFMGMASRNFGGGSTPFILRIVSMVPGILIAASGLMSIMLAQHTKATIDTSEMTRELLAIAKGQSVRSEPQIASPTNSVGLKQAGDRIKIFLGREILKHTDGVSVDGEIFKNVLEAEVHIRKQDRST